MRGTKNNANEGKQAFLHTQNPLPHDEFVTQCINLKLWAEMGDVAKETKLFEEGGMPSNLHETLTECLYTLIAQSDKESLWEVKEYAVNIRKMLQFFRQLSHREHYSVEVNNFYPDDELKEIIDQLKED